MADLPEASIDNAPKSAPLVSNEPVSGIQRSNAWKSLATPKKVKTQETVNLGAGEIKYSEGKLLVGDETRPYVVGPMPPQEFLDTFFPNSTTPDVPKHLFSKFCKKGAVEESMYNTFIQIVKRFTPNMLWKNTSKSVDRHFGLKPDIMAYDKNDAPDFPTDFVRAKLWIEVKKAPSDDPFDDRPAQAPSPTSKAESASRVEPSSNVGPSTDKPPHTFVKNNEVDIETLGQVAGYAAAHMCDQFIISSYSLLLTGNYTRFMRWDRAGVIVSARIDYVKDPTLLIAFLSRADDELCLQKRNVDPDASRLDPVLNATLISTASKALNIRDTTVSKWHFYRIRVPMGDNTFREFVAQHKARRLRTPFGRSTWGAAVYDVEGKVVVWLKDTWRAEAPYLTREGDILAHLKQANVPYTPTVLCHGDLDQTTESDKFCTKEWAYRPKKLNRYHHYRLVIKEVGIDLTFFNSSKQALSAIADAAEAHQLAVEAGILHRDISVGNILIHHKSPEVTEGLLIDWELSLEEFNKRTEPRLANGWTGTWQFVSAKILNNPDSSSHEPEDDRESFLYVILWLFLRYSASDQNLADIKDTLSMLDERRRDEEKGDRGGRAKAQWLIDSRPSNYGFKDRPQLDKLLTELRQVFATRYQTPEQEHLDLLAQARDALKSAAENNLPPPLMMQSFMRINPAYIIETRLASLKSPAWLYGTIRKYLNNPPPWPSDEALSFGEKNKRKRHTTDGYEPLHTGVHYSEQAQAPAGSNHVACASTTLKHDGGTVALNQPLQGAEQETRDEAKERAQKRPRVS